MAVKTYDTKDIFNEDELYNTEDIFGEDELQQPVTQAEPMQETTELEKGSRPWLESEITKHRGELKENPSLAPIVKIGGDIARSAGYTMGKVFEPVTKPIMQTIGKAIPEPVKKFAGETAKSATEAYREMIPNEGTRDVISSIGAIGTFASGLKGVLPNDIPNIKSVPIGETGVRKEVTQAVDKGIQPTVIGKKTLKNREKFYINTQDAVSAISENRAALNLVDDAGNVIDHPKTLSQFAQAIDKTKQEIYKKYNNLATAAGDAGATFNSSGIISKLNKLADSEGFYKGNGAAQNYAKSLIEDMKNLDGASPEVVQERIRELNESLVSYYAGRAEKVNARIDASIANAMREQLDDQITKATGNDAYETLKKQYGSLKAVEQEVNKAALKKARKNTKGLFDLTDIFTGGDIAAGIVTLNPALLAKGAAGIGIKKAWKSFNDPDRYVSNMFKKAYKMPYENIPEDEIAAISKTVIPEERVEDLEIPTYLRKGRAPLPEQPMETKWNTPEEVETPLKANMMNLLEDFKKAEKKRPDVVGIDKMERDAAGDLSQQVTEKKKLPITLPMKESLITSDIKRDVSKSAKNLTEKEKTDIFNTGSGFIKSVKNDINIDAFNKWIDGLTPQERNAFVLKLKKEEMLPKTDKDKVYSAKELADKLMPSSLLSQNEIGNLRWKNR